MGENATVLVLRILEPLSAEDERLLREFAERHAVVLYLQPGGPDSAKPMAPERDDDLHYTLPEFDLRMCFSPTDFTQVNHAVNRVLVRRAMRLLDPKPGERIADLFCGTGNFTLAIARSGARVLGIEGSAELVRRAEHNALANGLAGQAQFRSMDLFEIDGPGLEALGPQAPRRIVYVSCNPATLARDAGLLVHAQGYTLSAAGAVNMFPHTSHVESIAVFDRA